MNKTIRSTLLSLYLGLGMVLFHSSLNAQTTTPESSPTGVLSDQDRLRPWHHLLLLDLYGTIPGRPRLLPPRLWVVRWTVQTPAHSLWTYRSRADHSLALRDFSNRGTHPHSNQSVPGWQRGGEHRLQTLSSPRKNSISLPTRETPLFMAPPILPLMNWRSFPTARFTLIRVRGRRSMATPAWSPLLLAPMTLSLPCALHPEVR